MTEAQKPEQQFSRDELRYRIADAINDRLKSIPLLHATAKARPTGYNIVAMCEPSRLPEKSANETTPAAPTRHLGECGRTADTPVGDAPPGRTDTTLHSTKIPPASLVYPYLPAETYRSFFDFGCGCGRVARQLILQRPRPELYVGIDLNAPLIQWCNDNLHPVAPNSASITTMSSMWRSIPAAINRSPRRFPRRIRSSH